MTDEKGNSYLKGQKNKAEEPLTAYRKVRFFYSFEGMNQFEYRQYAKMTPEERLQTVLKIRKRVWPEEAIFQPSRHIYFRDNGDNL